MCQLEEEEKQASETKYRVFCLRSELQLLSRHDPSQACDMSLLLSRLHYWSGTERSSAVRSWKLRSSKMLTSHASQEWGFNQHQWSIPGGSPYPGPSGWSWRGEDQDCRGYDSLRCRRWSPQNPRWCFLQKEPHSIHSTWKMVWSETSNGTVWPRQGFLFPPSLGVGFLQQRAPKLWTLGRVDKQQLSLPGWKAVVDHHVHPLTKLPELQATFGKNNLSGATRKTECVQMRPTSKWKMPAYFSSKLWSWGTTRASTCLFRVREAMAANSQQSPDHKMTDI